MTGQDAVTAAGEFNDKIGIDGIYMTQMDSDARGGAALSIRAVTGKPIKFIGTGERFRTRTPLNFSIRSAWPRASSAWAICSR